ncbi:MAG: metalloregulator ArsR/SmtB family transcription factor [Candidatus Aenigmatarchaeota archaeon]|nr:metalloregulator ArsR/SmtB family transcription factor [Candidatus Aenigmarchaeota archaeon]
MKKSLFEILSNPTRVKIIKVLSKGELCACEIPSKVGKSQPNISQQLKLLTKAKILKPRRKGKMILYSLLDKRVIDIIDVAESIEVSK